MTDKYLPARVLIVAAIVIGAVLFYWLDQQAQRAEYRKMRQSEIEAQKTSETEESVPANQVDSGSDEFMWGKTFTEDKMQRIPAWAQELLADPRWDQPYIPPPAERIKSESDDARLRWGCGPLAMQIKVAAPLSADGSSYTAMCSRSGGQIFCDLTMTAEAVTSASAITPTGQDQPMIDMTIWAFRDGTICFVQEDGAKSVLPMTHRFVFQDGELGIYIVRLMVIDRQDQLSFADSLPINFSFQQP